MKKVALLYVLTVIFTVSILFIGQAKAGIFSITSPTIGGTTTTTPTITGQAAADAPVLIRIDGEFVGLTTADSENNWTYTSSTLSVGTHNVQAVWPKNYYAFISNNGDRDISVIETLTDSYLSNFSIDDSAILQDVVLTPNHVKAYVLDANPAQYGIWPVNIDTYNVPDIGVSDDEALFPYAIAASPDSSKVYVVNNLSGDLSVLNTANDTFIEGSPFAINNGEIASSPIDITVDPVNGDVAYVVDDNSGVLLKVSLEDYQVLDTINFEAECYPTAVTYSPSGTVLYVAEICGEDSYWVETIDTNTNSFLDYVEVAGVAYPYPQSVAVTPDGLKLLVVDNTNNQVHIINTDGLDLIKTLDVGLAPTAVAVNYNSTKAYATNSGSDNVSVIDLTTDTVKGDPVGVGNNPLGLGLLEDIYETAIINFTVVSTAISPIIPTPTPTKIPTYFAPTPTASPVPTPTNNPEPIVTPTPGVTKGPDSTTQATQTKAMSSWQKIVLWLLLIILLLIIARYIYKYLRQSQE